MNSLSKCLTSLTIFKAYLPSPAPSVLYLLSPPILFLFLLNEVAKGPHSDVPEKKATQLQALIVLAFEFL